MGLYHTHDQMAEYERADGSNCVNGGDLVCDTPADPLLGYGKLEKSKNTKIFLY